MDFEAMSDQLNKDTMLNVYIAGTSVSESTETLRRDLNLDPLISVSENHKITCEEDARQALSMSMQARRLRKALEGSRRKIVRPHLYFQKAINTVVKDYTSKLQEIEDSLKGKLDSWLELQSTFEPNFSDMMLEVQDGKITTKVELDFCVEDFDKIPSSYLMLDEKKVKLAIRAGLRNIPGIRIFEKKQTTMRIKNV